MDNIIKKKDSDEEEPQGEGLTESVTKVKVDSESNVERGKAFWQINGNVRKNL